MRTALLLAGLTALAGCSAAPAPRAEVATLASPGASASRPAAADPAAGRPRERLDMTTEEVARLSEIHLTCLVENSTVEGGVPGKQDDPAAEAACLAKKPLPPWEYDTANPESADFVHALVRCLRDKGVEHVQELPPAPGDDRRSISLGGAANDSTSITRGMQLTGPCEKEIASGGHR